MTLFPMSRAFAPVACGLALLAGCAQGPVPVPPGLREAGPAEVAACSYITDIQMTPGAYGPVVGDQALRRARTQVMNDALAAGGNTIVFDQVSPGQQIYLIHAKAYRC